MTVPTATGPDPVALSEAHPSGAARAALTAIRCHSAGISPCFCRALATASDVARAAAPIIAAPAAALAPCRAASDAPARPPMEAAKAMEERVATLATLVVVSQDTDVFRND